MNNHSWEFVVSLKKATKTPPEATKNVRKQGRVMLKDLTRIGLHVLIYYDTSDEHTRKQNKMNSKI